MAAPETDGAAQTLYESPRAEPFLRMMFARRPGCVQLLPGSVLMDRERAAFIRVITLVCQQFVANEIMGPICGYAGLKFFLVQNRGVDL